MRERHTKLDWAEEIAARLESRHAICEKVKLVLDNLNTHMRGALYEAFEPERAQGLRQRIKFQYTPRHGTWLNVAECESSCRPRQCLKGRRTGDLDRLRAEVTAWSQRVNARQRGVNWRMSIAKAGCRLKSVYPKIIAYRGTGLKP